MEIKRFKLLQCLPVQITAGLIRFYQLFLSPLKRALFGPQAGCQFTPTCSCYAREAFLRHGFFKGFTLAIWRLLRCHPFSHGGYDPVPERSTDAHRSLS